MQQQEVGWDDCVDDLTQDFEMGQNCVSST